MSYKPYYPRKFMKINDNIKIIDLALYLKKEKTIIISDMHLGYEESLNKQGILIPKFQFKETLERLTKIFYKVKADKIILNGDFKHEFGTISDSEWKDILKIMDFFIERCNELILIKGNHDTILGPIARKRNVAVKSYEIIGNVLVAHGDNVKVPLKEIKTIIIGHEHPAISLEHTGRVESYKCYLVGSFRRKKLVVQPSFNLVVEGTNVLKGELLSPFLQDNLDDFDVYVVSNKIYKFGNLGNLR